MKIDWLLDPPGCPGFSRAEIGDHVESANLIHHTEYLHLRISKRYALVNLTEYVEAALDRSGVRDGQ